MPPIDPTRLALAATLALLVAGGGYLTGSLSRSGALGAFLVGALVFGLGGPMWGALLVVFFVSSSLLSDWRAEDKAEAARLAAKGGRRDLGQVLANGSLPALLAVAQAAWPQIDLFPAFVGAIAAVTADTWATEIGVLSRVPPRLITSGQPVPPGSSGGVTVLGSSAAAIGGILIGLSAALFVALAEMASFRVIAPALLDLSGTRFGLLAPLAGLAGSAADSWLGATAQAVYLDAEGLPTERPRDAAGTPHRLLRGRRWVSNDLVNLAASAVGAVTLWGLDRMVFG